MALFSPGVEVVEKDFSLVVPNVASGIGGIAGRFSKGPLEKPTLIENEDQLVSIFGKPNDTNANEWFTLAEFFRYTNKCWVVRAAPTGYANATCSGVGVQVANSDAYEGISGGTRDTAGEFISKNPGTKGNGVAVLMVDSATWDELQTWETTNLANLPNQQKYTSYFSGAPSTSDYVAQRTVDATPKLDEMHIMVIDVSGAITGVPYTVLERYEGVSKASDATDYKGSSIYYVNVINTQSSYVWWSKHPTATNGGNDIAFGSTAYDVAPANKTFAQINIVASPNFFISTMSGGADGSSPTISQVQTAYDFLANKDLYNVDLVMCGAFSVGTQGELEKYVLENVANARKDCIGFCTPHNAGAPIKDGASVVTDVLAFKTNVGVSDQVASYGVMDSGMKYIFDRYNNKYRWVPLNGDTAGISARLSQGWDSPGGFNRGGIKNVLKFAFNPTQAQRDVIYPKGINPCIFDPQAGPIMFGDRTMSVKPSAFDRINVRRLFIILEKAISLATKWQLFEFNDSFTRAQFKNMVEPFLRTIQGRRGIQDFMVVCDSTNNTGDVIDRNEFVADIYVKPAKSINFVTLNFVATRTDVQFTTIVNG